VNLHQSPRHFRTGGATRQMRPCYVTLLGADIPVCEKRNASAEMFPRFNFWL